MEPDAVRRRSRIQRVEREFRLPKGLWGSLLIGALCVAAVITLAVLGGKWVRDFRAQQEEARRVEAERVERANYPLYYRELIERYAAEYNLDPALVAAVILCESSFNPDARSYLNARGLMQLMPATAGDIAAALSVPDFGLDRLYESELNIRMGCWYLDYLFKWFDNDMRKAVCAYHAGQGNVAAWLRNPEYSSDGVTLEVIATSDTAEYEARVQRAFRAYQKYHFSADAPGAGQ